VAAVGVTAESVPQPVLFDHAVRGETAVLACLELLEAGRQPTPEQLDEALTHLRRARVRLSAA